jgi:hypothetical protein
VRVRVLAQMGEMAYLGVAALGLAVLGVGVGLKSNTPMRQAPELLIKSRRRSENRWCTVR